MTLKYNIWYLMSLYYLSPVSTKDEADETDAIADL